MYQGYLTLGGETIADQRFELVNNERVQAYVNTWNQRVQQGAENGECIDWLQACDDCEPATLVFTNGDGYTWPSLDPAPWYDPAFPDTRRFFGVMGLDVSGVEDSTRSATVERSVAGGGQVSALRFGPREMVVRAVAVAADECALQAGLNWVRVQYAPDPELPACEDESLYFLDCCPSCEPDPTAPPGGPCWATTYAALLAGPADCPVGTFWPTTYQELLDGPPVLGTEENEWCRWLYFYQELLTGVPLFACDLGECLLPYLRNFEQVRVVSGPEVLQIRTTSKQGAFAELEFTIMAADPREYATEFLLEWEGGDMMAASKAAVKREMDALEDVVDGEMFASARDNPFRRDKPGRARRPHPVKDDMPKNWKRRTVHVNPDRQTSLTRSVYTLTVVPTGGDDMGTTRVGVWSEGKRVGGFMIPFVPAGGEVRVDSRRRRVVTSFEGEEIVDRSFARGFGGASNVEWPELPSGQSFEVTVDQEKGKAVPFAVEVRGSEMSAVA